MERMSSDGRLHARSWVKEIQNPERKGLTKWVGFAI
jgi:hypothetical protein